ncbi:thiol S-methyltransferase TMT1A [Parasteatoda tepidariorum]|uniref:thiol S-methyltransferase TMT1A n=1 Tax=Parasteatoda tepidariorum TaxID=114398 RepID=UPI00077F80CD|nr:methyltransferase-like protein 7A [Parasteatoda tepidariorum]XP_015909040.1 methyltransferase-like protein 7A [Parasteatoda tepidariorum]
MIEIFFYIFLTSLWWAASLSILLPLVILLLFSQKYNYAWFSFFYSNIVKILFYPQILPLRKKIFRILEENLPGRKKSIPLEILEIGIGPGANLQFYPENSNLTVLDVNPSFLEVFNKNKKNYPQVNYKKTILKPAEDMSEIPDDTFDVVVSTHVLCSVKNVENALKEVKRVLKPNGKYLFLEHVAYPRNQAGYFIQNYVAPIWRLYLAGCNPNRTSAEYIKKAGFKDVHVEVSYLSALMVYFRPNILGIATK